MPTETRIVLTDDLIACPLTGAANPQFVASTTRCVQAPVRTSSAREAQKRDEGPTSPTNSQWLLQDESGYTPVQASAGWFAYDNNAEACPLGAYFDYDSVDNGEGGYTVTINFWQDTGKTNPAVPPENVNLIFNGGLLNVTVLSGSSTHSTGHDTPASFDSATPSYYTNIP
jgi:hypothetical protein